VLSKHLFEDTKLFVILLAFLREKYSEVSFTLIKGLLYLIFVLGSVSLTKIDAIV
jgi:hypothetical protein